MISYTLCFIETNVYTLSFVVVVVVVVGWGNPFRQADGRKVLRSSIREFLCSEAIFSLGVPTTRAGSVVTSDSKVIRDINYDGNARHERCSVVLRIAPTFLRFGGRSNHININSVDVFGS